MNGVQPVGFHVVREPGGAADAGDEDEVLLAAAKFGKGLAYSGQNGVVAASRAPPDILIRGKVLGFVGWKWLVDRAHSAASSSMARIRSTNSCT
jgi:hypothetical protein